MGQGASGCVLEAPNGPERLDARVVEPWLGRRQAIHGAGMTSPSGVGVGAGGTPRRSERGRLPRGLVCGKQHRVNPSRIRILRSTAAV
eukprot:150791-Prymnesium_polylepis.1